MPGTDLEVVQSATGLSTPDPILSSESIGAFVVMMLSNLVILFGLDLTAEQQAAAGGTITGLWILGTFVHAAYVRGSRAKSGALSPTVVIEAPIAGSDAGDHA